MCKLKSKIINRFDHLDPYDKGLILFPNESVDWFFDHVENKTLELTEIAQQQIILAAVYEKHYYLFDKILQYYPSTLYFITEWSIQNNSNKKNLHIDIKSFITNYKNYLLRTQESKQSLVTKLDHIILLGSQESKQSLITKLERITLAVCDYFELSNSNLTTASGFQTHPESMSKVPIQSNSDTL